MRSPQHWFAATSSLALLTLLGGGAITGQPVPAAPAAPEPAVTMLAVGEIPPQLQRVAQHGTVDPLGSSASVVSFDHGTRTHGPSALAKLR